MKIIIKTIALLLILAGMCSCDNDDEIDMSNIDFSNIDHLYAQPLPVIQKAVQGKWKVYLTVSNGYFYNVQYPENLFIEFHNDHYIVSDDRESQSFDFKWKKLQIEDWMSPLNGCKTYVMYGGDQINNWYFSHIKNDTLSMSAQTAPVGYVVVRIK